MKPYITAITYVAALCGLIAISGCTRNYCENHHTIVCGTLN